MVKVKYQIYLLLLMLIMFSINASGKDKAKIEMIPIIVGDSINQLNEEQIETLDFAIYLLIENDSVVILPQEVNLLIGDTAKVNYSAYPDWTGAFFEQKNKNLHLIVPVYAETLAGIIYSQMNVERKRADKFKCVIETPISVETQEDISDTGSFSGSHLFSDIKGTFIKGKIYRNGVVVGEIDGEKQIEPSPYGDFALRDRYIMYKRRYKYLKDKYNPLYKFNKRFEGEESLQTKLKRGRMTQYKYD